MKNTIEVRALNDEETLAVMNMPKFDFLRPVRCSKCNHRGSFARRLFAVSGVLKSKFSDDKTQGAISSFIAEHFGISHVFFKSPGQGTNLFVDSAVCPECQSTKVVFDIELTSDYFREVARALGSLEE